MQMMMGKQRIGQSPEQVAAIGSARHSNEIVGAAYVMVGWLRLQEGV